MARAIRGLWYDDARVGDTYETPARTITEADIVAFCGLSGDFNELHTDAETMRRSQFGERIAHGALIFSIATGLRSRLEIFDGTVIAFAGIRDWRFRSPVLIGDTIHVVCETIELRASLKPDRGTMVQRLDVLDQAEGLVQQGEIVTLLKRRTSTAPASQP